MGRLCYNMAGKTAKGRNEKMIRLVTCDIDGTLLHGEETSIDAETLEEIRRLREKGILFCPASGRQYHSLRRLFAPVQDEIAYI